MIALVDCNSFYASCEQVFRPDLQNKPVVVLSNNDGCIIAANKQAKALTDIPMFQPAFKIQSVLDAHNVTCFSSNYTLYSNMSERVMNTLRLFSPTVEEYSIDESFVDLSMYNTEQLSRVAHTMQQTVQQNTGIPVGIGIAPTKSLAKVANKYAKKKTKAGIYVVDTEAKRKLLLRTTPIDKVWGIGRSYAKFFQLKGVETAYGFTQLPGNYVRKEMTVVGHRLWRELNGEPCLEMVTKAPDKQGIGTAKSFGKPLTDFELIKEACSYYVAEVADLLRQQQSLAGKLHIFLHTNPFSATDQQYSAGLVIKLPSPTQSTAALTHAALKGLRAIYKPNYRYKKVGINLLDLVPEHQKQLNLFGNTSLENKALTTAVDEINNKFGKDIVGLAATGTRKKEWELVKEHRSPRFTTQWKELLKVGQQQIHK